MVTDAEYVKRGQILFIKRISLRPFMCSVLSRACRLSQSLLYIANQTACPDTEQILVQPFVAQYFLYDRIISNCVFRRAYASGDLDANLVSGDGMVGFDGLAHGIGGLEGRSRIPFAGGGLDEVRAGIHG